ncbi:MAG: glycosyltransferase family 2 protein [Acidobacteriaceae bacterium]|nr:glycosyltransferase family 2 protein [Acidobacteriaceae bacterium]
MPEFSLVVATRGRTSELARLVASIAVQRGADYELILVDQNEDDRLLPVIENSGIKEKIRHLKCRPGVSRARNMGMNHAQGEVIGFPDDDCWYPQGLLHDVAGWFATNESYDILTVNSLDENGVRSSNRWFQNSCDLTLLNVYRTTVGYSIFVRGKGVAADARYDEGIGPGADTPYQGGEDSDYVLLAMRAGARGRFEAKWHVGHPLKDIRNASVSKDRAYIYGQGMGYVQRKHRLIWLWAGLAAFDFGRAIYAYVVGRREPASLWYWHGRGLLDGFMAKRSNVSA